MVVRPPSQGPVKLPVLALDRKIVDAGDPALHQALLVDAPRKLDTADDIRTVEDLVRWPVVDKTEMMADALAELGAVPAAAAKAVWQRGQPAVDDVDDGGGTATGGTFSLSFTVGQHDAGLREHGPGKQQDK